MPYHRPTVTQQHDAPGCRDATIATGFLLAFAAALFAVGLTLINGEGCEGLCETAGLTALYGGGPISALFGVFTDSLVIAWPLDTTLWVVAGFWAARLASRRGSAPLPIAVLFVGLALAYGLVLSQFVELTV
jgi:hypothetical protein